MGWAREAHCTPRSPGSPTSLYRKWDAQMPGEVGPADTSARPGGTRTTLHVPQAPGSEFDHHSVGLVTSASLGCLSLSVLEVGEAESRVGTPQQPGLSLTECQPTSFLAVCSYHTSSVYVLFFLLSEGETQFSIGFLNLKLISGAGSRCYRIMTFEVSRGTEAHLAPPLSRDPRPGPPASPSPLPVVTSPAPHGQAQVTIGSLCL